MKNKCMKINKYLMFLTQNTCKSVVLYVKQSFKAQRPQIPSTVDHRHLPNAIDNPKRQLPCCLYLLCAYAVHNNITDSCAMCAVWPYRQLVSRCLSVIRTLCQYFLIFLFPVARVFVCVRRILSGILLHAQAIFTSIVVYTPSLSPLPYVNTSIVFWLHNQTQVNINTTTVCRARQTKTTSETAASPEYQYWKSASDSASRTNKIDRGKKIVGSVHAFKFKQIS